MKILITVLENGIAPRFDQTTEIVIAHEEAGELVGEPRTIILPHRGAEALSEVIVKETIDCVICGGIEESYYLFFTWKKIKVIDGIVGSYAEALEKLLAGTLMPSTILPSAKEAKS